MDTGQPGGDKPVGRRAGDIKHRSILELEISVQGNIPAFEDCSQPTPETEWVGHEECGSCGADSRPTSNPHRRVSTLRGSGEVFRKSICSADQDGASGSEKVSIDIHQAALHRE